MRDDDSLPKFAMQVLADRLRPFMGRELSESNVRRIGQVVKETGTELRLQGYPMPPVVAVVIPRYGYIKLVRTDLPHKQIQRLILQIISQFPSAHPLTDIAPAIRTAFPFYNPADAEAAHHRAKSVKRPHFVT
jgi:hypothetical protein